MEYNSIFSAHIGHEELLCIYIFHAVAHSNFVHVVFS